MDPAGGATEQGGNFHLGANIYLRAFCFKILSITMSLCRHGLPRPASPQCSHKQKLHYRVLCPRWGGRSGGEDGIRAIAITDGQLPPTRGKPCFSAGMSRAEERDMPRVTWRRGEIGRVSN